jgi:hypothetical protein
VGRLSDAHVLWVGSRSSVQFQHIFRNRSRLESRQAWVDACSTIGNLRTLIPMKSVFFETKTFTSTVSDYLTEEDYRALQAEMLKNPAAGDVMPRTGGFRKLRWADARRGKGRRGGLRLIYYWLLSDRQFWMFAIYDKNEMVGLTSDQERALKSAIEAELKKRGEQ